MAAIHTLKAALLALMLCWVGAAFADVAVPPLTGRVVDRTATLGSDQKASLEQKLEAFEDRKGSQVAVLIVPTTEPETIEQYSIRVAEQWKIGRKKVDDGAILVVAKNDRKLRIEVGYGLEGVLTDLTSKRIIDEEIAPKFRNGDFAGGISAGVDRMLTRDRRRAAACAKAAGTVREQFQHRGYLQSLCHRRRSRSRWDIPERLRPAVRLGGGRGNRRLLGLAVHRIARCLRHCRCACFHLHAVRRCDCLERGPGRRHLGRRRQGRRIVLGRRRL